MCSFATRNATEFNLAMLRFVSATAGLLSPITRGADAPPHVARVPVGSESADRHSLLPTADVTAEGTRTAPGPINQINRTLDALFEKPGAAREFNLDACFTMVADVELKEVSA